MDAADLLITEWLSPASMTRSIPCWVALIATTMFTVASAHADVRPETSANLARPGESGVPPESTLRLNVSPEGYPPYLIVSDQGYSGIVWDIVTTIGSKLGFKVVAVKVPRKRVDEMLLKGYLDATPRAREWVSDPDPFLFTDPMVFIEEIFFVRAQSDFRYESPESLEDRTIVTHLGYLYPALEPIFQSGMAERFDVPTDKDMFRYLFHGERFDAVIADRLVGQWIIRNENLQGQLRMTDNYISQHGFRLMLRDDWQHFAEAFNRALFQLRQSGELEEILARYR